MAAYNIFAVEASAVDGLHHGQYAFKLWSDEVEGAKETDSGEGAEAITEVPPWNVKAQPTSN